LFIVINNIDFEEKIDYLSELYCLYAKQEITEIEFFRCCKILENSSYLDINDFEDKCYNLDMENGRLYLGIGLLEEDYSYRGKLTTHNESVLLKKTKVGEIFQKIKILIKN
ncbi:hypothetical protein, partial [Cetobacterium sp.]|uniref:hypothetical protein n=1 Tax=Cetobacterium sp. TaxID=2071632 RepID=UPI003F2B3A92